MRAAVLRPTMAVIFMSGYGENAAVNHGRISPHARILSKPFHEIDLATRIREVLDPPAVAVSAAWDPPGAAAGCRDRR